jgi:hypothetical protein
MIQRASGSRLAPLRSPSGQCHTTPIPVSQAFASLLDETATALFGAGLRLR